MRINDGGNRNAWREPDDGDVITRPQPAAYAPTPEPEAAAPAPAPTPPFWAAGTPVPPNVLDSLPPAGVQPPPEPEPAAAPAAPPPTSPPPPPPTPTPATALATPPTGYTGERPADPTWLAARETALVAVRSDYQMALAQAQANPGALGNVNPGWIPATVVTDESGQTHSASNAALVQFSDPNAPAVIIGWNEGSPIYAQPAGPSCEFNEAAFAASYQAQAAKQAGSPLQALATLYDSQDATTLFAQHPDLWHIATHDHAINAGPAKAGFAMGNASQLGMSDLYLADPQISALVNAYGGSVAPATGGIALEQVRLYGQQRYEQLSRLGNAMQSVRDQYGSALTQAFTSNTGPGWTERARTVTTSDESGAQTTRPVYLTDESGGQHQTITDRVFDPDAFTAWYVQQPGLQNKAFGDFYGASHTQYANDESGRAFASSTSFDNAHWSMGGVGSPMGHRELVGINPNDPPELNDNAGVGFDFEAGWATQRSNLHQDTDWFETAFKVVVIAAVAYFSAGTLGPAVAGSMGMSTAAAGAATTAATLTAGGMIVSAAVVGAATSLASGILNDNLSLKGVLRGALSGALTAGLMQGVGDVLQSAGAVTTVGGVSTLSTVGSIAARTTVQGAVQALMGGNFKDGAIAGLASGLAEAAAGHLNAGIDQAVSNQTMTAAEGFAAHTFARVIGSAIRAAANPGDPGQAFASAFLDDVFRQVGPPAAPTPELVVGSPTTEPGATAPVGGTEATLPIATTTGPALDDDGNLMPGAVDTALPVAEQMAALAEQLQGQGLSAQEAGLLAFDAVWRESAQVLSPPTAASANWSPDERQARIAEVEQALEQDLRAQQAREDSLLSPEDLLANAGGPGPARALVQPVLNRNFDAALNAAADVTGLFAPMQALQGDLDRLQALQAESRLDGMRQAMRGAGMTNVPEGFEKAWDANGNIVKDYKATLENLTKTYEGFVRDQRLRANWGDDYKSVRIGNSQMTVQDFETRSLQVQQRAANDAFERGKVLIATGQLSLKSGDYALTLGTYVDSQVRLDLRDFGKVEGIVDSRASNLFAVNRYIRGAGLVGIPDLRLGSGLFSDVTLSSKDGLTDQLRRWNVITPNDTIIIRPDQLGGAYVVPRSTIRPLLLPRKGP